jgi:hypothetical protein
VNEDVENRLDAAIGLSHDPRMVTGGIEGAGDALTGGIVARQFEPRAGEAHEGGHGGDCLNCGAPLTGPYCNQCGQPAHVHRRLGAFWHDLVHGLLHLDGKIWRTLPLLAWRPGALTRRYIDGERARFVSPMALFLFSVFLMVSVFHWVGAPFHPQPGMIHNGRVLKGPALDAEVGRAERDVAVLEAGRARAVAAHADVRSIDAKLADARQDRDELRAGASIARRLGSGNVNIRTGMPMADRALDGVKRNPQLAFYQMQTNAYKFSWALIPISLPFIWLMFFWRRDLTMFDHAVFATYSLSAMTLLVVVLSLLAAIGAPGPLVRLSLFLVPPVHMYRQLRGAYRLSRWGGLWRTLLLLIFALASALLFFLLLLALGATG